MGRDGRTDDGEERVHRPPIDRAEIHRLTQEAETDGRLLNLQEDRITDVGDRDTVADSGRSHRFARRQRGGEKRTLHVRRKGQAVDDRAQHLARIAPGHVVMDASGGQQRRDRRDGLLHPPLPLEQLGRNRQTLLQRPLPELDRIHEQTLVRPVHGEAAIADPFPSRGLAHSEITDRLREAQAHEALAGLRSLARRSSRANRVGLAAENRSVTWSSLPP